MPWAHPHNTVNGVPKVKKGSLYPYVWVFRIGAVFQGSEATAGAGQPAGAQGLLLLVPLMLGPNGKVTCGRFARNHSLALPLTCLALKYINKG